MVVFYLSIILPILTLLLLTQFSEEDGKITYNLWMLLILLIPIVNIIFFIIFLASLVCNADVRKNSILYYILYKDFSI